MRFSIQNSTLTEEVNFAIQKPGLLTFTIKNMFCKTRVMFHK